MSNETRHSQTGDEMDIEAILKALANPLRRDILIWLKNPTDHFAPQEGHPLDDGVCVSRIYEKAAMAQSTVSAYLAMLQRAGLVTSRREGQWTYYSRNEAMIHRFLVRFGTELCRGPIAKPPASHDVAPA